MFPNKTFYWMGEFFCEVSPTSQTGMKNQELVSVDILEGILRRRIDKRAQRNAFWMEDEIIY